MDKKIIEQLRKVTTDSLTGDFDVLMMSQVPYDTIIQVSDKLIVNPKYKWELLCDFDAAIKQEKKLIQFEELVLLPKELQIHFEQKYGDYEKNQFTVHATQSFEWQTKSTI